MTPVDGALLFHLHAHLPDVRCPGDWAEDWYFGAVFDTYLPLLEVAEGWLRDGVEARIGLSVSPPLLAMLEDPALNDRCAARLNGLARLAHHQVERGAEPKPAWRFFAELAGRRAHGFDTARGRALVSGLSRLGDAGALELTTSAASHALLPFLGALDPVLIDAQVRVGMRRHTRCFGRPAPGFWLPECAFAPGLDRPLAAAGLAYFFVDAHAARGAQLGTGAPLLCPSGTLAFARDVDCARRVWDAEAGYPTDARYREFHRDAGRELSPAVLERAGLPADGRPLGIKLHRITDRGLDAPYKRPYDPVAGQRAAEEHADDFVRALADRTRAFREAGGRAAVIVAPFDAELFGHWWFEGPAFLDRMARLVAGRDRLRLVRGSDVVRSRPLLEAREPHATTWGRGGYASTWLTPANHWVQDRVAQVASRMIRAARAHPHPDAARARRLDAMADETLQIAASDWPFLLTAGTFSDYAARRVETHAQRFAELERGLATGVPLDRNPPADVTFRDFVGASIGPSVDPSEGR